MKHVGLPPLMFITDRRMFDDQWVMLEALKMACWHAPSGAVLVHVREKDLEGAELASLTSAIVDAAHSAGQRVVVNDRMDVALACGADGVHLPENGLSPEDVRDAWAHALIGKSCHSVEACSTAGRVDYVTLSPIFHLEAKPDLQALGLDALRQAAQAPVAVYALGGVNEERAHLVYETGVHGVAMRRAWRTLSSH